MVITWHQIIVQDVMQVSTLSSDSYYVIDYKYDVDNDKVKIGSVL